MPLVSCVAMVATLLVRSPSDTVPADTIIARYLAAVGGAAKVRADTSLRFSGQYDEGTFHAVTTILWRRPNLRRVSVIGPDNFAYVELFDGAVEWEFSEAFQSPAKRDTGAAERAGRRGAEFDESFVDYAAKGHRVESLGLTSLDGHPVHRLHIILADGWEKDYYFDAATWLIVALRKAMPLHATGPDIESLSYYSDYRRVGGVLRPFRFVERNTKTGKQMNVLQWTTISANVSILPEAFRPPMS